jgi:hypothetical protein
METINRKTTDGTKGERGVPKGGFVMAGYLAASGVMLRCFSAEASGVQQKKRGTARQIPRG